ncbi:hypothetical protein YUBABA_01430 [Serratia phage vB_SmaM-Yubaba]|nr:hypothetical protein SUREIYA_00930 [Serratia phage vB_SmaM-Sureiya]UQT03349.1 hypothetical protein YUBABA_01430 [Serratia phage vB_SmaM-Yubaba]
MSAVDNIITVSNLFEVVSKVKEKVGYEFQAPLEADEQNEVTSRAIKQKILENSPE